MSAAALASAMATELERTLEHVPGYLRQRLGGREGPGVGGLLEVALAHVGLAEVDDETREHEEEGRQEGDQDERGAALVAVLGAS